MKIDQRIIARYNLPVPRYTSYPPANFFRNGVTQDEYLQKVTQSNISGNQNIAFYIHIPFCKKICYYCGCNACKPQKNSEIDEYINALMKEIDFVTASIDRRRRISQIHFGGGTPNAIDIIFIEQIVKRLLRDFSFTDAPEIAIECNPAGLDYKYTEQLLEIGFNRISLGIQDFDNEILKSVNRQPSYLSLDKLLEFVREKSPSTSINLDFIYGLPGQSVAGFSETITKAIALKPDRLVTFSYAHVPWLKKHQQILDRRGLPSSQEKMEMFLSTRTLLVQSGYKAIGLDHYVLPHDELNIALENHQLHRNFQGYCTRKTTGQVYAFGVSAISQLQDSYLQNVKDVGHYTSLINQNLIPVEKGYFLSENEIIIKEAIEEIMCNGRLDISLLARKYNLSENNFFDICNFRQERLKEFIDDNLIEYENMTLKVTPLGEIFIRNIAAIFDPAYIIENNKYSKTV